MGQRTSLARGGQPAAIRALCQRAESTRELRLALRAPLYRLLSFDAYCVNTCDAETGVVTSSVGDGLSQEHAEQLFALESQGTDQNRLSDLWRGPERVRSIWRATGGAPERSARMRQIFLPLGFTDELRAALVVAGVCVGFLHLFRRAGREPFSTAELRSVGRVGPLIASGLRKASARENRAVGRGPAHMPSPELFLLDARGRIQQRSAQADARLGVPDALPLTSGPAHVLLHLESRARQAGSARATLVADGGEPLSLSAVKLGADTAIVLDRLGIDAARELVFAGSLLTPRERAVSCLAVAGLSNQSIASELAIGLHTVKGHLKSVFSKLRCSSRAELAARLSGARP